MDERRNIASPRDFPEYIPGDQIALCVYVRHKRNITRVVATFVHEERSAVRHAITGTPKFDRIEEDSKISLVTFEKRTVTTGSVPGVYKCASLYAYYPVDERGAARGERLQVPDDLAFRVVREPQDTPKVERWEWSDPYAEES